MALCALAVLVAAGTFSPNAHAQCNIYMSTNQQAIDGYGFSSEWCGQLSAPKNNALFGTLGMSILRVRITDALARARRSHAKIAVSSAKKNSRKK